MALRMPHLLASAMLVLTGCSFGPHLDVAVSPVRDAPVLAGMSSQESLVRARSYLAARQYGLAIELFKAAGRDPALAAESLNGLAIAYDGIGRADLAERYFQKALAQDAGDERTRRNLATFYAASGQQEKRRALLASAPADHPTVPPLAGEAIATPASRVDPPPAPAFGTFSPLAAAFRPLLVSAGLPSSLETIAAGGGGQGVSVVCAGGAADAIAGSGGDGAMTIFRINMGEVFITSRPDGADCVVDGGPVTSARSQPFTAIGNTEYLGLIAAYLGQIDRLQHVADRSFASRTTL